jgi:hypothetical protein
MTIQLLNDYDVSKVRRRTVAYGVVTAKVMTRRAICRCCGEPIRKGETALRFDADYAGSGSWSLTTSFIHAEPCECAAPNVGCVGL